MEERSNKIRESLDDAERTRTEAQTILEEYQRQLNDARNEANRIIGGPADGWSSPSGPHQRAETEVAELRRRSQEDIGRPAARHRDLGPRCPSWRSNWLRGRRAQPSTATRTSRLHRQLHNQVGFGGRQRDGQ
jgi:hypothetical protein